MAGTVYYKMDDGTKIPLNPIPQASSVVTSTTNFDGILSGTDSTVQLALDTIDDHNHDSIYLNVANTTVYTPTANYHPATKKYVDDAVSGIDLSAYLRKDGTVALTANWDAGSWQIRAETFESDVATGTAPLVIASTTLVANLNSDLLDDQEGSYYLDLTNATNPGNLDHNSLNNLATGDVHTQYFLANCTRYIPNNTYILARNFADDGNVNMWKVNTSDQIEAGANIKLGTYSLGDGTGTLVFDGSGNLALNGGSFDIDAGEWYQIGGNNMFWADTSYGVRAGYNSGADLGKNAGGTVEENICVGGSGQQIGRDATGTVRYNTTIGGSLTGYQIGRLSLNVDGNLSIGYGSFYQFGEACSGNVGNNVGIGSYSGYNFCYTGDTTCGYNTIIGSNAAGNACYSIDSALNNVFNGAYSARDILRSSTGNCIGNTLSGSYTGYQAMKNTAGVYDFQNNVFNGYMSGYQWAISDNTDNNNNILLGAYSGYLGTGSYQLVISSVEATASYTANKAAAIIQGVMSPTTSDQELFLHATTQIGVGASNYTQIDNDGYQTMAGTARVIKTVWIDASGLQAPGTKPATLVEQGIGLAWEFTDGTDDTIECRMVIPNDMDRTVAPTVKLGWSTPTANAGNCRWQVEYLYRAPGEDMTAAADATLVDNYACDDADDGLVITSVDVAAPGATDACLTLRIKRRADEAGDTLGEDNHLYGICLSYTANCLGTQAT